MGQTVTAIVYGVPMTKEIHSGLRDDDGEWRSEPPLDIETGGVADFQCIGLTVAVQNVPEDGEVDLPECPIADLAMVLCYGDNIEAWKDIAKWAKSHKVKLGRPQLLLVQIERA